MTRKDRRSFIKKLAGSGVAALSVPALLEARPERTEMMLPRKYSVSANEKIRLGMVGMGIMGYNNAQSALKIPGVELAGVCDLYQGRLDSSRENFGKDIFVTKDYKELINKSDIDAICVSTSDHWHDRITIEALKAGKTVYCEKPMMHRIEEGKAMLDAEQSSGKVLQVGSQRVSSIMIEKAAEIYRSGAIGELVMVETYNDRFSRLGAWQYSIPTDASAKTVDWKGFLGDAPKQDFDAKRFFRWRNYQDYGTGVAGDLFVHLFSGLHTTIGSLGPNRIYATGGLRYWEDGRDVPDVMLAVVDYPDAKNHPAFNLQIRVNFVASGGGGSIQQFVGTEGTMEIGWGDIKVRKNKIPNAPGYGGWDSYETFSAAQKKDYELWYQSTYPENYQMKEPSELVYRVPEGYSDHLDHWTNFIEATRSGGKVVEDAAFGIRAAAPSLATNLSLFENRIINWDPANMKLG